jgi:hypothetical protein
MLTVRNPCSDGLNDSAHGVGVMSAAPQSNPERASSGSTAEPQTARALDVRQWQARSTILPCVWEPQTARALDVGDRLVFSGDGAEKRLAIVSCPDRAHSIPIEECMQCDRCACLHHDASQGRFRVMCRAVLNGEVTVPVLPARVNG